MADGRDKKNFLNNVLKATLTALAYLPLPVLYIGADVLCFVIHKVVRYRRRLVRKNLELCFPELSERQRRDIEDRFYHNFADYIVETIKLLHISDHEMLSRFEFENLDAMIKPMEQGRSVVAYFAHTGNWEWAPSVTLHCPEQVHRGDAFCQIYRPLRNEIFDRLMLCIRSRFGSISIPKAHALRWFLEMRREGTVSVTGFMSDQKPSHGDTLHVLEFLGRPTAVITGTESLARRLHMAAVYWDMRKIRRGYYSIRVVPMTDDAAQTAEYELTDTYFSLLEQTIRRNPAIWLWTHNRWKHPIPTDAK